MKKFRRNTTQKEFEFFGRRVMYWQEKMNLMDWRIDIYMSKIGEKQDAGVKCDFAGRCAAIIINDQLTNGEWSPNKLDRAAFHEVMEIMLSKLAYYAEAMIKEEEVEEAVHQIIRTLENVVVPECRGEM